MISRRVNMNYLGEPEGDLLAGTFEYKRKVYLDSQ
jgi:hypothetical protein